MSEKRNMYIGARYVPLFDGEHSNEKKYEPLTIVSKNGNSYTSRTHVPVGIDITNEKFWALTGNYNAQIEQYRQDVRSFESRIEKNKEQIAENIESLRKVKIELSEEKEKIQQIEGKVSENVASISRLSLNVEENNRQMAQMIATEKLQKKHTCQLKTRNLFCLETPIMMAKAEL